VQAAQEYMGEADENITRMATILPGASTLRGGVCGILLGAVASVGLKYGSIKREERGNNGKLGPLVHDFFEELTKDRYGTINCRDIAKCDFTNPTEANAFAGTPEQHQCAGLLAETIRFLLPILDNPDVEK
jgi:hypothetical protein